MRWRCCRFLRRHLISFSASALLYGVICSHAKSFVFHFSNIEDTRYVRKLRSLHLALMS